MYAGLGSGLVRHGVGRASGRTYVRYVYFQRWQLFRITLGLLVFSWPGKVWLPMYVRSLLPHVRTYHARESNVLKACTIAGNLAAVKFFRGHEYDPKLFFRHSWIVEALKRVSPSHAGLESLCLACVDLYNGFLLAG